MGMLFTNIFLIWFLCIEFLDGQTYQLENGQRLHREKLLNPIRIHAHFQEFNRLLSETDIAVVKEAVDIARIYLKQLLSVVSVHGPLLLKRSACARSWLAGPNKGRCAYKRRDYYGEFCKGGFKIPDEHLKAFVIWEYNATESRTWFREGEGIRNADYILYVQAITTSECVMANYKSDEERLIAYAAECMEGKYSLQQDMYGRPVAGYINICPSALESGIEKQKLILTVIHEMLHNLGFSKEYFDIFKDCSEVEIGPTCPPQRFPLYRKTGNFYRMLTTSVLREMQKHFLCFEPDFGGPLEVKRHKYQKDAYSVQSHWDHQQMYGSIMAPSIGPPELTYVDPISLALLEDSGWYKVNYSSADSYPWGHGKGCNFGNKLEIFDIATCKINNRSVENGCNVFHTHKIVCSDTGTLDSDVLVTNSCNMNKMISNNNEMSGETVFLSRCLLSNVTGTNSDSSLQSGTESALLKGECFRVKCSDSKTVEVSISDSFTVPCPVGQIINISVFGFSGIIVCPSDTDLICFERKKPLYFIIKSEVMTTADSVTDNVTILPRLDDVLKIKEISGQNLTSKGIPSVFYEKLLMKIFYTSVFCIIMVHLKINDRLLFCMF